MKTIKNLFLLFFLMSISSGYALTDYCATPRASTSNGGAYSVNFTCRNVGGTTYEYKLEFAVAVSIANANIAVDNVTPGGSFTIGTNLVLSNGNKTASVQFTSSTTPKLFVNYLAVTMAGVPGVVEWNQLPIDGNFAATCGGGGGTSAPITFANITKTVGDANFTLSATSDSAGAFTYVSGNTSIVQITGNTAQIIGAGTTSITANQAAAGSYTTPGSQVATITVNPAPPSTAAPTPPARNSWDVKSIYSDAYTEIPGVVHQHGIATTVAGNPTRYLANMLLSRIAFGNTNFSAMTTLHVDVYCATIGTIWLQLPGSGFVTRTVPASGWVSLDVPVTAFTGSNLASINFFDLNNPTGAGAPQDNVWVDNIYFYRPATTLPPTLGTFTVGSAVVGDADFVITPPASTSNGAWSYSSSNPSVATIVGASSNMIHVVGGGTSTITATQAADGSFGQGVATATFTATYPPLTTAAPVPPIRETTDVMSVYSNAYTPVPGTRNYNPNWGQSTAVTNEIIGGDNLLKYTNLNYQGVNIGSTIDVSGMSFLHIDVYTQNETAVTFYLISTADGVNSNGERGVALTPLTLNGWNSYDIPLSSYTSQAGFSVSSLFQLKTVGSGGKTIYLDNIYFWKPAAELINPTITLADENKLLGDPDFTIAASSDSPGTIIYGSSNPSVATISGNTVHIVGAGTTTITASQAASGLYNPGSTTATLTVTVPPLTTAAPTPPARNDWDVISLYSDAYPTLVGAGWQFGSDVELEGNATRYIENMLLARLAFPPTNVSAMTHLHIDFYSETLNPTWFELAGNRVTKSTPVNGWVSLDIPLSEFVGLNLANVNFFDLNNPTGAVAPADNVYVDNVYFYRPATTPPATLSDFSIPTKAYNDPDFALTPPTSNSDGAFTYSSSNPLVATINPDNTVHIVGGGVSTITATQAASDPYGSASITALLTVTFAPPSASPVPPARTPERVISLFTGNPPVYANAITPVGAAFSSASLTEVANGTNTAYRLDDFGVLGLMDQAEARFDVSGMSHLHIDFYLNAPLNANPALSRINVFLLANGDYLFPVSNLVAGWNSISIPMTNFAAADETQVWGLKFENINSPTQIYIDNIYFSDECYTYYADADNDTFGDPDVTTSVCDGTGAPAGYVTNSNDCDDTRNSVNPLAGEVGYNLIDDDCDGSIDEGFPPKITVIQGAMCNMTLAAIDSQIVANIVPGAQGYRWRITTVDGPNAGQEQFLDTALRTLRITQLANYAFNTKYKVEVAVYYTGFLQPFAPSTCTVTTPAISTALAVCGQSLTNMSDPVYANLVAFASGYRFRITDPLSPTNFQVLDRSVRDFRMNQITNFVVRYGKVYNVEVALKNTDGTYLPYGGICQVSTPVFPTTFVQDSQCDNYNVPTNATQIYAVSYAGAIGYAFQISGGGLATPVEVVKTTRTFTINDFAGQLMSGATYNVKVRLIFNLSDPAGPYGKPCSIVTPGVSKMQSDSNLSFDAVAYPNPFSENFNINVTTSASEKITVKVYDMTGRLLESKTAAASEMESLTVGENFPSGVYNMTVGQGNDVKTLHVIKR